MAWQTNSELPSHVRTVLPEAAQTRFRLTANEALEGGSIEKAAIIKAWVRVREGWNRPPKGEDIWVRKSEDEITKAKARTLYVSREVKNAAEIIKWAKGQGFKTTLKPGDLHVTIAYSKRPIDWMKIGDTFSMSGADGKDELVVKEGGPRLVEPLGDKGAVVLLFASEVLQWRHERIVKEGASWDFEGYQPHVTITWDAEGLDLSQVEPYTGKIVFGPEIFKEVNDNWSDNITEKFKADYAAVIEKFDANQPRDADGQ